MKDIIFFLTAIFLGISFLPIFAFAKDLKKENAGICNEFMYSPDNFKKIEAKAEKCSSNGYPTECDRFSFNEERFAIFSNGGSCGSTGLGLVDANGIISQLDVKNAKIDGVGMGSFLQPVSYKNRLFLTDQDGRYLYRADKDGLTILCGISYNLKGWKPAHDNKGIICQKFSNQQYIDRTKKISPELSLHKNEASQVSKISSNILGKDKEVEIVSWEMASGRGCGCDRTYLSVEIESADQELKNLDEKLSTLTQEGCHGNVWSVVTIDNRDYIMKNWPRIKAKYSNRKIEDQLLFEYREGSFQEICRLHPEVDPFINDKNYAPE